MDSLYLKGSRVPRRPASGSLHQLAPHRKNTITVTQQHVFNRASFIVTREHAANGLLLAKTETHGQNSTRFDYEYDPDGRLQAACRDGAEFERYWYNSQGQRFHYACAYRTMSEYHTAGDLEYDAVGRCVRSGRTTYAYDGRGALRERANSQGVTQFFYNGGTALDSAILPDGTEIRYEYAPASPINPVRRFKNGALTGEYEWDSPIRLGKFLNYEDNFICEFIYADDDEGGALTKLRLTRASLCAVPFRELPPERLAVRFALGALLEGFRPLELSCARDQVGTPKVLTGAFGKAVKVCDYSSFGVPVSDSFPQLFIPVGFAGGLLDRDTGLVRFGWRDYDPEVGRFTAPDPARDARGDGDLYDYCADDPVNRVDPTGLKFSRAAAVAGGESHKGISHPFGAPHGTSMTDAGGKSMGNAGGKNISNGGGSRSSGGKSVGGGETGRADTYKKPYIPQGRKIGGMDPYSAVLKNAARVAGVMKEGSGYAWEGYRKEKRPLNTPPEIKSIIAQREGREPKPERRYYVVLDRDLYLPLSGIDTGIGEDLGKSNPNRRHRQLFANDGTNFGLTDTGPFSDNPNRFPEYEYSAKHGATKYDADCIEAAQKIVDARLKANRKPGKKDSNYRIFDYNCQHYVDEVIREAEKVANRKGIPLIVN